VQAENDYYALTADARRMAEAIETARQARAEEATWPGLHYLWPQHPIVEWLGDRVLTHFGRHCAPVLRSAHLRPGEQAFVLMGLVPNRKGQPLLVEWQVACRQADAAGQGEFILERFASFAARAGLRAGRLPNAGGLAAAAPAMQALQGALPGAVAAMRTHMVAEQQAFAAGLDARLRTTLAELERLQGRQLEQLAQDLERQLETVRRGRFEHRRQQINRVFDDYRQWVHDTLTTEPQPWIQVLAAVTSSGA